MLAIKNRSCQQADRRWQIAFENSAIGIMLADFTGRFFAANSAFLDMLRYTESELYQLTFIDVTYEEDRKLNLDLMAELVGGRRRHFEVEKRYYRKNGSLVWARTNYALVPGTDDLAPFWFGIVEDVSRRKQVEEELGFQIEAMTRLHEFSTELLAINEFHLLLEKVLDATISLQNADFGTIQLYDPVTQALEIAAQRGFKQDFLEHFKSVRHTGAACGRAM